MIIIDRIKKFFIAEIASHILSLPRFYKQLFVLTIDIVLVVFALYLSYCLRLGYILNFLDSDYYFGFAIAVMISMALAIPIFYFNGLYSHIYRYAGLAALGAILKAATQHAILFGIIVIGLDLHGVPRTICLINALLLFSMVGASRLAAKLFLNQEGCYIDKKNRILIYGAGSAGRQLSAAISNSREMKVVGFLDDDPYLQGQIIYGNRIYSPINLASLIDQLKVGNIFIALPSLRQSERNSILKKLSQLKVNVRMLPGLLDLAQGKVTVSDLRELDVEDLLERNAIDQNENLQLLIDGIAGRNVMVTGAGGSIGSELCRQIIRLNPKKLILVDHSEIAIYKIQEELLKKIEDLSQVDFGGIELIAVLGSVVDIQHMKNVIGLQQPHVIYHAAAYKHVPIVESNPFEGIKNNTFGTLYLAQLAMRMKVPYFVLISTDKAVNPTNVMGASKRLSEMVLQALAALNSCTIFTMVRFGNVLDSSGSVIPKFREQIKSGGPVTVTDQRITRYFMTIPEASLLVIYAGVQAKGGEVFLLDMGEPVRIIDLARKMIELSGFEVRDQNYPQGDIEIVEIGLRPGEKLFEELLIVESSEKTSHSRIYKASEEYLPLEQLSAHLDDLQKIISLNDGIKLREFLTQVVRGYRVVNDF